MGVLDVLKSIPSDVGDIVTGVPEYVTSLPHQMQQIKALTGFSGKEAYNRAQQETGIDYGDTSLGGILRNMSRTPVFNAFVPGLHTAANLTTEEGRSQMAEHPLATGLDLAALFGLTKAGVGRIGGGATAAPGVEAYFGGAEPESLIQTKAPAAPPGMEGLLEAVRKAQPSQPPSASLIEQMFGQTPAGKEFRLYNPKLNVEYNPAYHPATDTFYGPPGMLPPGSSVPSGPLDFAAGNRQLAPGDLAGPFQDVHGNFYPPITGKYPDLTGGAPKWHTPEMAPEEFGGKPSSAEPYEPPELPPEEQAILDAWETEKRIQKMFRSGYPEEDTAGPMPYKSDEGPWFDPRYNPVNDYRGGFPIGPFEDIAGERTNLVSRAAQPPELPETNPNSWGRKQWLRFLGRPENMTDAEFNDLADALQNSTEGKRFGEVRGAFRAINRGTANNPWTRGGPFYDIAPQSKWPLWMTAAGGAVAGGPELLQALQTIWGGGEKEPSGNFLISPKGEKIPFEPGDEPIPGYLGPFDANGKRIYPAPTTEEYPGDTKNRPWNPDWSYSAPREHTTR